MSMNAVAYMRCSGMAQIEGDTFERQSSSIAAFASSNDLLITQVYRDEGVTGTRELENRPGLNQMLADIMESGVQTIVIEKLDRLARDVIVQENIIRYLQNRNITILSASPAESGLCSEDPTRKFIRVVLGASAQLEKDLLVWRTRVARERIRARGEKCEGRKAFGKDDEEAEGIDRMMRMRAVGASYSLIAKTLDAYGHKTREGKPWYASTVRRILLREKKVNGSLRA